MLFAAGGGFYFWLLWAVPGPEIAKLALGLLPVQVLILYRVWSQLQRSPSARLRSFRPD